MANVARLMAMELPRDAKISRDAKILMQEMVSELICFLTSEANDLSLAEGRKALSPDDILNSFETLDLASFAPVMEAAKEHMSLFSPNSSLGDPPPDDTPSVLRHEPFQPRLSVNTGYMSQAMRINPAPASLASHVSTAGRLGPLSSQPTPTFASSAPASLTATPVMPSASPTYPMPSYLYHQQVLGDGRPIVATAVAISSSFDSNRSTAALDLASSASSSTSMNELQASSGSVDALIAARQAIALARASDAGKGYMKRSKVRWVPPSAM